MNNARKQVDLVGLAPLLEDLLGPVALLGGEDAVGLGGRDGERALEATELVLLDERRVGDIADLDAVLEVPANVLDSVLVVNPSLVLEGRSKPWRRSSTPRHQAW